MVNNSYCAVKGCRNAFKAIEGVTFFTIPFDSNRAKAWIRNLNLTGNKSGTVICSDHFDKEDFVKDSLTPFKRLSHDAVPLPCVIEASPDHVVDEEPEIEVELPMPSPQHMKHSYEDEFDSEIKTEETDSNNLQLDTAETSNKYCHACLSHYSSVTALSGCLRDTYVELCGAGPTAPAMCHLCRRLLLNATRFREQCRAAFSLLQYVNSYERGVVCSPELLNLGVPDEYVRRRRRPRLLAVPPARGLTSQNISDDYQKSLLPHLNLKIVKNCNFLDIKHEPDAFQNDDTEKPTENAEIKKELEKTTPSITTNTVKIEKESAEATPSKVTKKVKKKPTRATPLETAEANVLADTSLPINLDSDDDHFSDTPFTDILFVKTEKCNTADIEANAAKMNAVSKKNKATRQRKTIKKNASLALQKKINKHMTVTSLTPIEMENLMVQRKEEKAPKRSQYQCDVCFRNFGSKQSIESHMFSHSSARGNFVCDICQVRFSAKRYLRTHVYEHMFKYSCKLCPFTSLRRSAVSNHIAIHQEITLKCSECRMIFHHRSTYLTHRRIHHPTSSFVCQLCGYSFLNQNGVRVHKLKIHALDDRAIPEDGPLCDKCNTRFIDPAAFNKHLEVTACADRSDNHIPFSKNTKRKVKCEQCHQVLQTINEYRCHMKAQHPDAIIQTGGATSSSLCDVCGKKFSCLAMLKQHLPLHDPTSTYPCDQCGGSYASPARLAVHKKQHTGVRFACGDCGREFTNASNRDRHVKYVHSKVESVKCNLCGKVVKSDFHRRVHMAYVHFNRPYPKRDRKKERAKTKAGKKEGLQSNI